MFMLASLALSIVAIVMALGATSKADTLAKRVEALESQLTCASPSQGEEGDG